MLPNGGGTHARFIFSSFQNCLSPKVLKNLKKLAAEGKVGLMLNVREKDLASMLKKLPALERPTMSPLAEKGWYALNTIVSEHIVRDLIPELLDAGATGIVEYPLNKIVN